MRVDRSGLDISANNFFSFKNYTLKFMSKFCRTVLFFTGIISNTMQFHLFDTKYFAVIEKSERERTFSYGLIYLKLLSQNTTLHKNVTEFNPR